MQTIIIPRLEVRTTAIISKLEQQALDRALPDVEIPDWLLKFEPATRLYVLTNNMLSVDSRTRKLIERQKHRSKPLHPYAIMDSLHGAAKSQYEDIIKALLVQYTIVLQRTGTRFECYGFQLPALKKRLLKKALATPRK